MKRYKYFYVKNLNRQSDCIVSNPRILKVIDTGTFTPTNLNRQSDCIVSNPRIFKHKAIQVLLRKKIGIDKAIVSLQTAESLSDEARHLLLLLLSRG